MSKTPPAQKSPKEPGRIKQMWEVFQMTRAHDRSLIWRMLLCLLIPVSVTVALSLVLSPDNGFVIALWIVAGLVIGLLIALAVMGKRAERMAYAQIEGKPGAVGAVLNGALGRRWIGDEMPISVNPKTHEAVYRAVGRAGVALVGEGSRSRVSRMLDDEQRRVSRLLPNVAITVVHVGNDPDSTPLARLPKTLKKKKKTLTRAEMAAVSNRLSSLKTQLPIPKGMDPLKARPGRMR